MDDLMKLVCLISVQLVLVPFCLIAILNGISFVTPIVLIVVAYVTFVVLSGIILRLNKKLEQR